MTFFYDLNARLAKLATKQEQQTIAESKQAEAVAKSPLTQALTESAIAERSTGDYSAKKARAGKDIGKPGKAFAKIAKSAGEKYGSKERGEKVAGAVLAKLRKEDITDEGNAFTGALAKTPKGGKFKVGNKEFTDTSSLEEADVTGLGEEEMDEGYAEMDAWLKSREKEKGTGRFDKKKISTGTVYTRKPETFDDPETDPEATGGAPKRKGRPAGTKRAIGAKHSGRSKLARKDAIAEEIPVTDRGEYDDEAGMAKDQLHTIVRHAKELEQAIGSHDNLPEWVQEKMGQIKGMMTAVTDYMLSQKERGIEAATGEEGFNSIEEKAPPGAKAERMVKHIKKSLSKDGKLSDKDKAIAYATTWKAHNAGKVEEEGANKPDYIDLDKDGDKKEPMKQAAKQAKSEKKEEVEETTTSGSVATASASPKASKGMQFGKGVYESLDAKLENMISEGMSINVNMNTEPHQGESQKSITVQADGEDADKLAELLKMAGLGQQKEVCSGCGSTNCGCEEELDENSPDWPTNTETLDAQPELRTYSGGLNGPKSTGQTTVPVVASQLRRQVSMEENVELERTLFKTWKNYKG